MNFHGGVDEAPPASVDTVTPYRDNFTVAPVYFFKNHRENVKKFKKILTFSPEIAYNVTSYGSLLIIKPSVERRKARLSRR